MFVAARGAWFRAYERCQRPSLDLSLLSEQTGYIARVKTMGSDMLTRSHPRHGNTGCVAFIVFTRIPPATQGGRERVDTIAGPVRNARLKQQIVIYAHSRPWWVQPWPPYLGS
jgi:hypothetical protein